MSWQHRVCKSDGVLSIHEYFMENGEPWGYTNPVLPIGEDVDELITTLEWMLKAAKAYKDDLYEAIDLGRSDICESCGARRQRDTVPQESN